MATEQQKKKVEELLSAYEGEMVATLQKWVRIPSVMGEAAEGAPYGKDVRRMLDAAIGDLDAMGFETGICDGHAGYADLGTGDARDALAVLAHLDVVPEGTGWDGDPYSGDVKDGKIYGRGTSDDKGPAVAAVYAMKAVKEAGIPLRRKVRLILGCNEEVGGGEDLEYFASHAVMPRCGFSPDATYPVINIEKGGLHLCLSGSTENEGLNVIRIHAGTRANVIPGEAEALVEKKAGIAEKITVAALPFPVTVKETDEGTAISTVGKLGHAAMPDQAKNAIGQLMLALKAAGVKGAIETVADVIGTSSDGKGLGIAVRDELSGALTASMDIFNVENGRFDAVIDVRFPLCAGQDELVYMAKQSLPGISVTVKAARGGHYVSEKSELVRGLLKAYEDATGLKGYTVAIGGGTYAHYMEEGVAFGATFPDEPDMAHQANEYMSLETLYRNMRIFANTIIELAAE